MNFDEFFNDLPPLAHLLLRTITLIAIVRAGYYICNRSIGYAFNTAGANPIFLAGAAASSIAAAYYIPPIYKMGEEVVDYFRDRNYTTAAFLAPRPIAATAMAGSIGGLAITYVVGACAQAMMNR